MAGLGAGDRHAGQLAAIPGFAPGCACGRAGGQIGRSHDALPGHLARRLCIFTFEHGVPKRRNGLLRRERRTGRGGVQPEELRLGQQNRFFCRHAIRFHLGCRAQRHAARARRPLQRQACACRDAARRPGGHSLHQWHHRSQQGRHAHAHELAEQCAGAQGLLVLAAG